MVINILTGGFGGWESVGRTESYQWHQHPYRDILVAMYHLFRIVCLVYPPIFLCIELISLPSAVMEPLTL